MGVCTKYAPARATGTRLRSCDGGAMDASKLNCSALAWLCITPAWSPGRSDVFEEQGKRKPLPLGKRKGGESLSAAAPRRVTMIITTTATAAAPRLIGRKDAGGEQVEDWLGDVVVKGTSLFCWGR